MSEYRSLNSFGVSGLLSEECKIYHATVFSTLDLGRVTDLMAARLRKVGANEFDLRAVLFKIFSDAFRFGKSFKDEVHDPLVIECGADKNLFCIGISFQHSADFDGLFEGLSERIHSRKGDLEFDRSLIDLVDNVDDLVIRHQKKAKRCE